MAKSSIEWTGFTWNPVTGCTKLSAGCKFCYAEKLSHRLQAIGVRGYTEGFTTVTCHPDRLSTPLKRKKPTVWFVNSMSDLFHEKVPFVFIDRVMDIISATPQHTYQILTKRPSRMAKYFRSREVPGNTWLGVSVENKRDGVPRIALLREIQVAPVRFLSVEPLLEDIGHLNLSDIHWVIVGGESGRQARPMRPEWVNNVRHQCRQAKIPFFFKQWGAWGEDGQKRSKKANGRSFGGQIFDALPILKNGY